MKGRGIGTARGRATIMRGKFSSYLSQMYLLKLLCSEWYNLSNIYTSISHLTSILARRGRGAPPVSRGIRR